MIFVSILFSSLSRIHPPVSPWNLLLNFPLLHIQSPRCRRNGYRVGHRDRTSCHNGVPDTGIIWQHCFCRLKQPNIMLPDLSLTISDYALSSVLREERWRFCTNVRTPHLFFVPLPLHLTHVCRNWTNIQREPRHFCLLLKPSASYSFTLT